MISTESWQVCGLPRKNKSYMLRQGWTTFCKENNLMEGDICTFNIIETTSWHVIITRYKEEMINQLFCESVSASKRKSENDRSSSEEKMRLKCSMTSLNKASSKTSVFEMGPPAWIKGINGSSIQKQFKRKSKSQRSSNKEQKRRKSYKTSLNKESSMTKCVFEIGPSAWIKKEMNDSTIERQFCLPLSFCKVIGLRKPCMITLKTSPSSTSTSSWLVIPTRIAVSWLDQVGRHSAMRTRSGWEMSALSKSLKLPSGMSSSSADKLGLGSIISSPIWWCLLFGNTRCDCCSHGIHTVISKLAYLGGIFWFLGAPKLRDSSSNCTFAPDPGFYMPPEHSVIGSIKYY